MFDAKSNDGSRKGMEGQRSVHYRNPKYKVTEILSNGKKAGERLTAAWS